MKGLKICGISDPKTLDYIINHPHPPKYIGFICNYPKSKRFVKLEKLKGSSGLIYFSILLAIKIGAKALIEKFLIIFARLICDNLFSGVIKFECRKPVVLITRRSGFLTNEISLSKE